jgi:hypothetical protein
MAPPLPDLVVGEQVGGRWPRGAGGRLCGEGVEAGAVLVGVNCGQEAYAMSSGQP